MIPDHLTAHVIEEILPRLPLKSILRFKCVCKIWCSVISDRRRRVVLICENFKKFSTITIESILTGKNRAPTPIPLPWETGVDDQNHVLGSCKGLVCVDLKNETSPDKGAFILWNPSTRNFKRLPRPSSSQVLDNFVTYAWFGYHELVGDYKLVWLNCSRPWRRERRLDVFTMRSNTWRRIPIDDIELLKNMHFEKPLDRVNLKSIGFFYKGAIHWGIVYFPLDGDYNNFIFGFLAFDLATEEFRRLKFPEVPVRFPSHTWVGSIGGCLCLSSKQDDPGGVSLWMMKEYGVESSWTKLISVPYMFQSFPFFRFYPSLDPNMFSKEEVVEVAALLDYVYANIGNYEGDFRLRIEGGGGENVRFEETLYVMGIENVWFEAVPGIRNGSVTKNSVVLHMVESLVSQQF